MPGYQGMPGSYGDVRAAVAPNARVQAQSGSYLASYGSASRSTDGAPWSGSSYGAVASQQATAEAEYLALQQIMGEGQQTTSGLETSSHRQGASESCSSASGRYQAFDFGAGPYADRRTQTTHQQPSQSGSYQSSDRGSSGKDTDGSAASLYRQFRGHKPLTKPGIVGELGEVLDTMRQR